MKDTFMAKAGTVEKKWYLVDAEGKTVGRLAAEVAKVLRGKNKPIFTPHVDTGDYVIVINAAKVVFTGKKLRKKVYFHHTGYLGGGKYATAGEWMQKFPERVLEHAVKGMLPKNLTRTSSSSFKSDATFIASPARERNSFICCSINKPPLPPLS